MLCLPSKSGRNDVDAAEKNDSQQLFNRRNAASKWTSDSRGARKTSTFLMKMSWHGEASSFKSKSSKYN